MDASDFNLRQVGIVACQPQAADSRKIGYVDQRKGRNSGGNSGRNSGGSYTEFSPEVVYLVKLYMDLGMLVDRPSQGFQLYVGDTEIRKYAAFKEGIYFKIHDVDQLAAFSEQEIRFCVDHDEMVDSGVYCPAYAVHDSEVEVMLQTEALSD